MNRSFTIVALTTALCAGTAYADGDLDTTFNDGTGSRIVQFNSAVGNGSHDTGRKVLIDKNNRMYLIGTARSPDTSLGHFALTRLGGLGDQAGQGDLSFGFLGGAVTPDSTGNITATSAAFDNNGNIVVAGFKVISSSNFDFFTCVFNQAGGLGECVRPVFDAGTGQNHVDVANDVVIDKQNRVLLAGYAECYTQSTCAALVRLLPNGKPDSGFGINGYLTLGDVVNGPVSPFAHRITAVALDDQGRILLAGTFRNTANDPYIKVIVERLLPNGNFDPDWGQDGVLTVGLGNLVPNSGDARATDIVFDERGNSVFVAGTVARDAANGYSSGFVMKLGDNGSPVPNFNMDGFALLNPFPGTTIESMARTHDGNYVLGGSADSPLGKEFLLQKISYINGQYISNYAVSGRRRVDIDGLNQDDTGMSVAISPYHDYTVLLGNTAVTNGQSTDIGFSVARLDSDVIFYHDFQD